MDQSLGSVGTASLGLENRDETTAANAVATRAKSAHSPICPDARSVMPIRLRGLYGHDPLQNHLLAALPPRDFQRLLPDLEFVVMPSGMSVCEADMHMTHVYFPTNSVVSLLHETRDGSSAETAVIGNEGMLGVTLFMGGGKSLDRATVKSSGYGFRLKSNLLTEEFARGGALQRLLLNYTRALLAQMSQTAVCNRHHSVSQQLCRWLLLTLDRISVNEICVTQSLIATMLGVRRESVTCAANKLHADGVIEYARGRITVLDRPGLEKRACECYAGLRKEYDRLLASRNTR